MKRSLFKSAALSAILLTLLAACTNGGMVNVTPDLVTETLPTNADTVEIRPFDKNKPTRLRIYTGISNQDYFDKRYGQYLRKQFPNISFEQLPPSYDISFKHVIDEQKADIVWMPPETYYMYADSGKLLNLDVASHHSPLDAEQANQAQFDIVRAIGNGVLYGTPLLHKAGYNTSGVVLAYNKDLFAKFKVPVPKDGMTWDEIFALSRKFANKKTDSPVFYGLHVNVHSAADYMLYLGRSQGLSVVNKTTGKVNLQTKEWANVFNQVVNGIKTETIQIDVPGNDSSFQLGNAAMSLTSYLDLLYKPNENSISPNKIAYVMAPMDPESPNQTGGFRINDILAVNAQSNNLSAAWEVVKFLNSKAFLPAEQDDNESIAKTLQFTVEQLEKMHSLNNAKPNAASLQPYAYYFDGQNEFASDTMRSILELMDGRKDMTSALAAIQGSAEQTLAALKQKAERLRAK